MGSLPVNWRNISGLNKSKDDNTYLKTLGWVPLIEINVIPNRDQIFNDDQITINKDSKNVPESVELKHHVREMNILEKKQRDDSIYSAIRVIRTEKLFECDWTMVSDSKLSEAQKTEWVNYRQQLRDLPATADITKWNTSDWVWPTPPE